MIELLIERHDRQPALWQFLTPAGLASYVIGLDLQPGTTITRLTVITASSRTVIWSS